MLSTELAMPWLLPFSAVFLFQAELTLVLRHRGEWQEDETIK
jgi:hypothetical protein